MTNPLEIRPGDEGAEQLTDPTPDILSPLRTAGNLSDADLADADITAPSASAGRRAARNISRGQLVRRRFLRKKLAVFGLVMIVALVLLAWFGPFLTHWKVADLDPVYTRAAKGPSNIHFFGTDDIGHDLYVQTLSGLQKSLIVGFVAAILSTSVAGIVGSLAGYFGGITNNVAMWFVDLLLVVPSFLIIAIISPQLRGKSFILFAVVLAAFNWMITARVVRGMTLSLREREFVSAARFMGVNPLTIIGRHILPNIASFLIVDVTLNVSGTILLETSLSYFGFGVQPPDVTLGSLIATGTTNPGLSESWLWIFPGAMLLLVTLGVNFIGDGLRDAVDSTSGSGAE
jgi:peptide/nickel transport system permease protein